MADAKKPPHEPEAPRAPAAPKLPYEPPAVVSEEVFETLALACGKTGARCSPNLNS
jgi:hypothetical protein